MTLVLFGLWFIFEDGLIIKRDKLLRLFPQRLIRFSILLISHLNVLRLLFSLLYNLRGSWNFFRALSRRILLKTREVSETSFLKIYWLVFNQFEKKEALCKWTIETVNFSYKWIKYENAQNYFKTLSQLNSLKFNFLPRNIFW